MKITLNDLERKELHRTISKHIHTGEFKLSSGKTSPLYFDLKSVLIDNVALYKLTSILRESLSWSVGAVGGMELGALGLIYAFTYVSTIDSFVIRKNEKSHGLTGRVIANRKPFKGGVVLVDDVITTGKTVDECVEVLNSEGYQPDIEFVFCIVDRTDGSYKKHPIHSLFTESDFQI